MLKDGGDSFAMSCADHLGDVITSQGLTCQQTFSLQVWTCEYGLLITLSDSNMHIPNIVSLNTAIVIIHLTSTSLLNEPQCKTSWVTTDWFMKTCAGIFQLNFLANYLVTIKEVHTALGPKTIWSSNITMSVMRMGNWHKNKMLKYN